MINNRIAGAYVIVPYKDGEMIDQIYLFPEYRNYKSGTLYASETANIYWSGLNLKCNKRKITSGTITNSSSGSNDVEIARLEKIIQTLNNQVNTLNTSVENLNGELESINNGLNEI